MVGVGCAEDPSPDSAEDAGILRLAQDRLCLSPGEGEEGRRLDQMDIAHSLLGLCKGLLGEGEEQCASEGGVGWGWVRGRPLTECRWVHRRLPLPQERVKRGGALIRWTSRTRSLGYAKVSSERVKSSAPRRGWCWLGLGARKTPHPAAGPPASPGGRGKRGRAPEEAGVLQRSPRRG